MLECRTIFAIRRFTTFHHTRRDKSQISNKPLGVIIGGAGETHSTAYSPRDQLSRVNSGKNENLGEIKYASASGVSTWYPFRGRRIKIQDQVSTFKMTSGIFRWSTVPVHNQPGGKDLAPSARDILRESHSLYWECPGDRMFSS